MRLFACVMLPLGALLMIVPDDRGRRTWDALGAAIDDRGCHEFCDFYESTGPAWEEGALVFYLGLALVVLSGVTLAVQLILRRKLSRHSASGARARRGAARPPA